MLKFRKSAFLVLCSTCLCATCLCLSCATTRFPQWNNATVDRVSGESGEAARLQIQGDELYAQRGDLAKLTASTMKWEIASKIEPSAVLFAKLSRAHYLCAQRTMNSDDKALSIKH